MKNHINEITGIGRALERFYRYYRTARLIRFPYPFAWAGHRIPQIFNLPPPQDADGLNAFTLRFLTKQASFCLDGSGLPGGIPVFYSDLNLRAPVPEFWWPKGTTPLVPGPVTAREMTDAYWILALGEKAKNRRLIPEILVEHAPGQFGHAQAGVFNPDGADLFSQAWRSELMPATRYEPPGPAAELIAARAPAVFDPIEVYLRAVSGAGEWERVNAH